jgi:hypothetical protein
MRSRLMQYRSDPLMQYHSGVDSRYDTDQLTALQKSN